MANDQALEVSADHIVYANGAAIHAADVKVGDRLAAETSVLAIRQQHRQGLYAPVKISGNLLVSGACVSSYVALWKHYFPWLQNWATHMEI